MSAPPAYERDPYLRELEVEVLATGGEGERRWALLDDTILYPEGGGQPADRGLLGEVQVVDVQREKGEVRHYVDGELPRGATRLSLDWRRRYDHMQQHTAQHLLSALAGERGWITRSFHLGARTSDIELAVAPLSKAEREELESAANDAIAAALPLRSRRVAPDELTRLGVRSRGLPAGHRGDVRLVEIEGVDLNTCGGTHLRSTAEIGAVKLLGAEPLRGGCRLAWVAGARLRRRLGEHEERNAALRRLFDTGDEELLEVAGKKLEQLAAAGRRERQLEGELAAATAAALAARDEPVVDCHLESAEVGLLRRAAAAFVDARPGAVILLTGSAGGGHAFVLAAGPSSGVDLRSTGAETASLLEGRGGGSARMFQGKAGSLARRADAVELLRRLYTLESS